MDISFIINHLGEDRIQYKNAVAPPIFQTSNFCFDNVASMREAIQNELKNPFYTRGNNPTVEILRKKIAALEGYEDALIFSSGSAAIAAAVNANLQTGDHVVCVHKPYSWTYKLFQQYLKKFGVETTFVNPTQKNAYKNALQPNTKLFFLETPNSLTFEITDLEETVKVAKENHILTILDNSYSTPLFQRASDFGIDLVCHSATKYLSGHSDVVAGVVCANQTMIEKIFYTDFMNIGGILAAHDAALILRGLRTLPLRIEKIYQSTLKVVNFLENHPKIEKVYYPFSSNNPQYELAKKQMKGCTGLFSIELKNSEPSKIEQFCNSLQLFLLACSWGSYESLVFPGIAITPLPEKWNLIRLSIGLDEPDALIKDLEQALSKI
ncbi:MAG: cystathionine gamma-synthase [Bacteroidia bacterium]|nr:MAG: cystathionine gamma-synthase [Bacteroidia bacterium]